MPFVVELSFINKSNFIEIKSHCDSENVADFCDLHYLGSVRNITLQGKITAEILDFSYNLYFWNCMVFSIFKTECCVEYHSFSFGKYDFPIDYKKYINMSFFDHMPSPKCISKTCSKHYFANGQFLCLYLAWFIIDLSAWISFDHKRFPMPYFLSFCIHPLTSLSRLKIEVIL